MKKGRKRLSYRREYKIVVIRGVKSGYIEQTEIGAEPEGEQDSEVKQVVDEPEVDNRRWNINPPHNNWGTHE